MSLQPGKTRRQLFTSFGTEPREKRASSRLPSCLFAPCESARLRLLKILFDTGTPKPIARSLPGDEIAYARQIGRPELKNGELIEKAEETGYRPLLSTDKTSGIGKI